KIGPMLRLADVVVITKGDIISQVEREVFAYHVRLANPGAKALFFNGITGQGAVDLAREISQAPVVAALNGSRLRFPMPSAVCPYCVGETALGEQYQRGNVKKMLFPDNPSQTTGYVQITGPGEPLGLAGQAGHAHCGGKP
ncbi:MAG: hypothetical protein RL701_3661, partial [Pseudomonadota bacterium]